MNDKPEGRGIIFLILLIIFVSILSINFLIGCKSEVAQPEIIDITGYYRSVDYEGEFQNNYDIKLFLVHAGKTISGIGEFNGAAFSFNGVIKGNEVMITFLLIYQGYIYQCKLDLFYSENYYPLSGGATITNGTKAIRFEKYAELEKHNQGGVVGGY